MVHQTQIAEMIAPRISIVQASRNVVPVAVAICVLFPTLLQACIQLLRYLQGLVLELTRIVNYFLLLVINLIDASLSLVRIYKLLDFNGTYFEISHD